MVTVGSDVAGHTTGQTWVVVPCYNEASRLDLDAFSFLLGDQVRRILFVDDGSIDDTRALLSEWLRTTTDTELLPLDHNVGKAEAVRAGLQYAIERGASTVAYFDADLAAPIEELLRAIRLIGESPDTEVVMGARVALLGTQIHRTRMRHYQGRLFATVASLVLGLRVYDTQCGLKVLKVTPTLREAVGRPFRSRWSFDVELLGRMLDATHPLPPQSVVEMPLRAWRDVGGSTLSLAARVQALTSLWRIALDRRRNHRSVPV